MIDGDGEVKRGNPVEPAPIDGETTSVVGTDCDAALGFNRESGSEFVTYGEEDGDSEVIGVKDVVKVDGGGEERPEDSEDEDAEEDEGAEEEDSEEGITSVGTTGCNEGKKFGSEFITGVGSTEFVVAGLVRDAGKPISVEALPLGALPIDSFPINALPPDALPTDTLLTDALKAEPSPAEVNLSESLNIVKSLGLASTVFKFFELLVSSE